MLPSKVEEVINSLSTTFIKMKGLRRLPQKVDERRNQLLEQGRTIVRTLKPYAKMEYSKEEYEEVYRLMFKRKVAQYIEDKPKLTVESATAILSESKKILKEYTEIVGDTATCSKSFMKMIDELKTFITDSL
jgi:F0F1-type ATP synthase alpha subunit